MVVRPIVCKRFIGRAEELAFIGERRHEAGRSRSAMIIVKGEAGASGIDRRIGSRHRATVNRCRAKASLWSDPTRAVTSGSPPSTIVLLSKAHYPDTAGTH